MRLVCNEYGINLVLDENKATEICFDTSVDFLDFITQLNHQVEGEGNFLILSEDDKEIPMTKKCELIIDPIHVDPNNRRIITRLYQELLEESRDMHSEEMMHLRTELERYVIALCDNSDVSLTYKADLDFTEIFKMFNVRIDSMDEDFCTRILTYIRLLHRKLGISIFFFVNLRGYMAEEVMDEFIKSVCYEKVHLFLLERYEGRNSAFEQKILIDKDACILYN